MDTPGHTMCHICLRSHTDQPALFSRRHAVQCRRRQLPQRRQSGGAVHDLRRPAREAARRHARLSGPRLHREQPALHARARARQRRARGAARPRSAGRIRRRARVTTLGEEKRDQHLLPPDEPERDRGAARGVSRPARAAGPADGVRQAARAAQHLVTKKPAPQGRRFQRALQVRRLPARAAPLSAHRGRLRLPSRRRCPRRSRGFWVPQSRTALANTKSRKLSSVMWPSSTSS